MLTRIAPGIFHSHVPGKTLAPYHGTECYWIGTSREVILVDTGDGSEEASKVLEGDWTALGQPMVRAVFATHYHADHTGGGAWALTRFGSPLYLHERDIRLLGHGNVPWTHFDEDQITVGDITVELLLAPGHTPGQWNLWIPAVRGLLAGDNVLGNTTVVIIPPEGHLGQYMKTLETLKALNPLWIGPGHGKLIMAPNEYLTQYMTHRNERSEQILSILLNQPMTPREVASIVYRDSLPPARLGVGEWMVRSHLEWLTETGMVRENRGLYERRSQDDNIS